MVSSVKKPREFGRAQCIIKQTQRTLASLGQYCQYSIQGLVHSGNLVGSYLASSTLSPTNRAFCSENQGIITGACPCPNVLVHFIRVRVSAAIMCHACISSCHSRLEKGLELLGSQRWKNTIIRANGQLSRRIYADPARCKFGEVAL